VSNIIFFKITCTYTREKYESFWKHFFYPGVHKNCSHLFTCFGSSLVGQRVFCSADRAKPSTNSYLFASSVLLYISCASPFTENFLHTTNVHFRFLRAPFSFRHQLLHFRILTTHRGQEKGKSPCSRTEKYALCTILFCASNFCSPRKVTLWVWIRKSRMSAGMHVFIGKVFEVLQGLLPAGQRVKSAFCS